MKSTTNHTKPTLTAPDAPRLRPRVLKAYDGHGAYAWHLGDLYFLAASELNEHLAPGTNWNDSAPRARAVSRVIAEVEIDPRAVTLLGSFRFDDIHAYRRHRRRVSKLLKLARRLAHWPTTLRAMAANE